MPHITESFKAKRQRLMSTPLAAMEDDAFFRFEDRQNQLEDGSKEIDPVDPCGSETEPEAGGSGEPAPDTFFRSAKQITNDREQADASIDAGMDSQGAVDDKPDSDQPLSVWASLPSPRRCERRLAEDVYPLACAEEPGRLVVHADLKRTKRPRKKNATHQEPSVLQLLLHCQCLTIFALGI